MRIVIGTFVIAATAAACGGGSGTETSSTISAADGGTVDLGDEAELVIPASALPADTEITLRVADFGAELPALTGAAGATLVIEPDTISLAEPAQLTFVLAAPGAGEAVVPYHLAFEDGAHWSYLEGNEVGDDGTVHVDVQSFGTFAVAIVPLDE
jgi:hypothetical protein